jgi:hypothetical protein
MTRDSQRQKVYDAQQLADPQQWITEFTRDQTRAYVHTVLDKRTVRSRWGTRIIIVNFTRGSSSRAWRNHIQLGLSGGLNQATILHELAHSLNRGDGHGPEFVGIHLFLIRLMLGRDAWTTQSNAYKTKNVRRSNAALPAVKPDVPPTSQEQERQHRRQQTSDAHTRIHQWLDHGIVTTAQLIRIAQQ